MNLLALALIAVGVSMDAGAICLLDGVDAGRVTLRYVLKVAGIFGTVALIMPTMGYLLGGQMPPFILEFDHWIAYLILSAIGASMILSALDTHCARPRGERSGKLLMLQAVATSLDAMAIGLSLAALEVEVEAAVLLVAGVTVLITAVAVAVGRRLGRRYACHASLAGGLMLLVSAIKILIEHLFFGA